LFVVVVDDVMQIGIGMGMGMGMAEKIHEFSLQEFSLPSSFSTTTSPILTTLPFQQHRGFHNRLT
jgi:hypothetical protein